LDSIMPKVGENATATNIGPRLVVLDAPNIAMRHGSRGDQKKYSSRGVQIAVEFYQKMGHKVIAFLPDYHLDSENASRQKSAQRQGVGDAKASKIVDDVGLLQKMCADGTVVAHHRTTTTRVRPH
jgi:hypothetical protein